MGKRAMRIWRLLEPALPGIVLAVLFFYTCVYFWQVPYAGFLWDPPEGWVAEIYVPPVPGISLQLGDLLVQVGPTRLKDFYADPRLTLFDGVNPGDIVPLQIERQGQPYTIQWVFPGFNRVELRYRLASGWPFPYLLWAGGVATWLLIRPKDVTWRLLLAFYWLTAFWMTLGNGVSRWHLWESAILLRAAMWLSVPVYLHLHWVFPQSFRPLPPPVLWAGYGLFAVLALAEIAQLMPDGLYIGGFLLTVVGSLGLIVAHGVKHPAVRREIGLLGGTVVLALVPAIILGIALLSFNAPSGATQGTLILGFPALPAAYFYAIARRRLGGKEVRANRFLGLYLFGLLFGSLLAIPVAAITARFGYSIGSAVLALGVAGVSALGALQWYPPFQRWVERHLLGIPWIPEQVVEKYADQITLSLDQQRLKALWTNEVLPTLLVRQAVLSFLDERQALRHFCNLGVSETTLPTAADMKALLAVSGRYPLPEAELPPHCAWVRLVLPLKLRDETIGIWLLGRRDPDDFYAQTELPTLQTLANQTAIALHNIMQAEQLYALSLINVERHEAERAALARTLHDEVLNQLALLVTADGDRAPSPELEQQYQDMITSIRHMITGLRPAMLTYGLGVALEQLVDEIEDRPVRGPQVVLALDETHGRYPPVVEQHLLRIVQQAVENALRHARAKEIRITGTLEAEQVVLIVADDGQGFDFDGHSTLTALSIRKHYGLVGMYERATLIGATLTLASKPHHGTRVALNWRADTPKELIDLSLPSYRHHTPG